MLHIQMAARRDWDFHKYIPNVISFLPHYHHSDMHTSVSKLALFCIRMWQWEQHTDLRGEDRQRLRGSGGCSLQSPQAEPEAPRAGKDRGVLRAWDTERTRSPLESSACARGCLWARDIVGEGWSHTCSLAPLLYAIDWTTAAFACIPSLQNTKKKKIYMSI